MQGSDWFGWDELTLIFLGFFVDYRYEEQTRSKLRKTVKYHRATWKSDTLDRGKGVPSFNEMMDIALVEVDFDDPTTNVRGRRALAIAKPTPRGY